MTPPRWTGVDESLPVAFLAGPIQGTQNYQIPLAKRLISLHPNLFVASPRRIEVAENFDWDAQVGWEKANLGRAAFNGVIGFWFAAQDHSLPYESGRPYAQTSRIEIGRVAGWKDKDPGVKLQIGIDPKYSENGGGNERYFRSVAEEFGLPVSESTEELAERMLEDLA